MFPIISLSYLHFFPLFFSFCCSDWIPLPFLLIFSSSSSLLLNPSYVYFSSVIVQLCDCYWVLSYCSVSLLTFCVPPFFSFMGLMEFSEHLYDHYFEFFIRSLTSLHFIKDFSCALTLLFHLEHIPLFLHFPWHFVLVSTLQLKQPPLPILKEWPCVGDKAYPSTLS